MWPVFIATPMVLSGVQVLLPALPAMKAALRLTDAQLGLVTSLYLLPSVLLALPSGVLADRLGRRALLSGSLAIFGAGGIILTLYSNSFALILGVRLIQGAAFAATLSVTITILGDAFEGVQEITAQSYRSLAMKIGDGALPIIGGAVAAISWFAPFATQIAAIPLAAVVWFGLADLPDERRRSFGKSDRGALLLIFRQWSVVLLQVHGFLRFFMKFAFLAYSPLLLSALDVSPGAREHSVAVIRIKSDVVSWSDREEKHAGSPGTFGGSILAYSTVDGRPLALIQDGVLQHWRVGAAAAVGTDWMARPGPVRLGLIGSGGMAAVIAECLGVVRPLTEVKVFSPNPLRRSQAAESFARSLGVAVKAVDSPHAACEQADVIVTATSSLEPTVSLGLVPPGGTHHRREPPGDRPRPAGRRRCPCRARGLERPARRYRRRLHHTGWIHRGGRHDPGRASTPSTGSFHRPPDRACTRRRRPSRRSGDPPGRSPLGTGGGGHPGRPVRATVGALLARASELGAGTALDEGLFLQQVRS